MTLTTRLLLFFLGSLALVLAGFSIALYLLADGYLRGQVDARLESTLDTLVAAAEVRADGVEWEPHERVLHSTQAARDEAVSWTIRDDRCEPLPTSPVLVSGDFLESVSAEIRSGEPGCEYVVYQGQTWLVAQRRVEAQALPGAPPPAPPEPGEVRYPALVITAASSLAPLKTELERLSVTLVGLSFVIWSVAAFVGYWICRRAIAPVGNLARTARSMSAMSLDQRLPAPGTKDEMDEFVLAFNDLLNRLQDSFERQRRFSGDASHQLRTPLTAMLGQVEVALRRARTPEEYREVLDQVHRQAVGLRQIVESLLFLARADTEADRPPRERTSLSDWLRDYITRWATHPRAGDFHLDIRADDECNVDINAPLLAQLIDNLTENALKYSDPGSPISLRLSRESAFIALVVEDSGQGIAIGDLPHIFEPFYRSTTARRRGIGGVGLGLAVAKRIAEVHSGVLSAESAVGRGSRFTFRLTHASESGTPVDDPALLVPGTRGA
jgi:heavy metal sensor kinase